LVLEDPEVTEVTGRLEEIPILAVLPLCWQKEAAEGKDQLVVLVELAVQAALQEVV